MSNIPTRTVTPTVTNGTTTATATVDEEPFIPLNGATLRLRAEPDQPSRRIQWAEDVVDNEGMGKKSSKVCCIYHKPKNAGDSSSDESSSDSDSDSEPDLSRAQGPSRNRPRDHDHDHDHHNCEDHDGSASSPGRSKGKGKARKPSPNAYERVPKRKPDRT